LKQPSSLSLILQISLTRIVDSSMKTSHDNGTASPRRTQSIAQAADWNEHEHVSEQVQLEAQRLVDQAGSPGIAKMAIEVIEQQQRGNQSRGTDSRTTSDNQSQCGFLDSLKNFETTLETPIVSGELRNWAETAKHACEELGEILCNDLQNKHAELFTLILKEDNEMGSRVKSLSVVDEELRSEDLVGVQRSLDLVLERASTVEPDESKVTDQLDKSVKQALAFVIKSRTQETAISTWFMEAFNRDRGVGD